MDYCMNASTVGVPARRRLFPLWGQFPFALYSADGSPTICIKSNVHRLGQTAEQLHAVDSSCHNASFSFVRSRGRHIGGYIISLCKQPI